MRPTEVDGSLTHAYARELPVSRALHAQAQRTLAGAASHDSWRLEPFAPVFEQAQGPYKWDADGRRYVDYWMGHGALLLGHTPTAVVRALQTQIAQGLHLGGLHRWMLEWAERVRSLVPSAEQVRFTASGTEATLLALRIARAYTGRAVVARLDGHYHGWHDEALAGALALNPAGLHPSADEYLEVLDGDPRPLAQRLAQGDVAALILEPGGGSCGGLPWSAEELQALRRLTQASGTLLIFDEVVSGFRYAPGGVQALCGVLPDLTVLGKVLAGGCAGGAVAGRAAVMRTFGAGLCRETGVQARVTHAGTFNGNPLAAVAGVTTLGLIGDGTHQEAAAAAAATLARSVSEAAARADVDVRMFAARSIVHLVVGTEGAGVQAQPSRECFVLIQRNFPVLQRLRLALLVAGVDMHPSRGWVSSAHDAAVIQASVTAFERAFALATADPDLAAAIRPPAASAPQRRRRAQ